MKSIRFLLTLILSSSLSALAETYWEPSSLPPQFCVQNFNAYGPIYARKVKERTDHVISFLKYRPKCEIVQLQEVWNGHQIDQLERALQPVFNISSPNRDARIGLMSFSMGDILDRQTFDFKVNNEGSILDQARTLLGVKKGFHVVRTKLFAVAEELDLINTHLHPGSTAVRLTQILDLLRWRLENQNRKFLLSGDFNAEVSSLERNLLMVLLGAHDGMEEALAGYPKEYCTYCAQNPTGWLNEDRVFDYIFFSNIGGSTTSLRADRGQVNMQGGAKKPWSDHYGIRVHFFVEPSSVETSRDILEARKLAALQLLQRVRRVLEKEKSPEFAPYLALAADLAEQLRSQQGQFTIYFNKFR